MASETPWKTLHPASVVVNLIPRSWNVATRAWPLFLALIYGGRPDGAYVFDLFLVGLFFAMTMGGTILHWLTLRYRVHEGRLEIMTGLLNRRVRVIAPDRIQNTETVQNVFHKVAGLVEVRVETASGKEVEGLLSALAVADAELLVAALEAARSQARRDPETEEADAPVLASNDPWDLIRYGLTASRVGALAFVVAVAMEGLQFTDPGTVGTLGDVLGAVGGLALMLAIATGVWLAGAGAAVMRHFRFRLLRVGRSLVAEEGLFTRRRVELPIDKVQLVTVSEPWLRRLFGFGSLQIETAAIRDAGSGTQRSEAMVPVVAQAELYRLLNEAVPIDADLGAAEFRRPHPRALLREALSSLIRTGLLALGASWLFWPYGLVSLLALPLGLLLAWLDHRYQGWLVTDRLVVSRRGFLNRRTLVVARRKLQSMAVSQGLILRRWGLGQLRVRVAGSSVALPIQAWNEALALQEALIELPPAETVDEADAPTEERSL